MSSIWSSGAASAGASPFDAAAGAAPKPGNGAANRFASMPQPAGRGGTSAGGAGSQVGLSPKGAAAGKAQPMAASGNSSGSNNDSGAAITANDFLTLLVTEMQNQDPTADTDPNEYINQLVQINSLEQLISINQNLTTVLGTASGTTPGVSNGTATPAAATGSAGAAARSTGGAGASPGGSGAAAQAHPRAAGNLSVPQTSGASRVVAHSLDGHARAAGTGHAIRDIPTRRLPG